MVGCRILVNKKRKAVEWLGSLLGSKFFEPCDEHEELKKNEKNMFCIDCSHGFCKHCLNSSPNSTHRQLLQICKYVYHDVVRLQDIQKHLDCSHIQTYKINGEKAVHLNPRPQLKETFKVSKCNKGGAFCEACGRHIQEILNRFCSISCKVRATEQSPKLVFVPISQFNQIGNERSYNEVNAKADHESSHSLSECSDLSQEGWVSSVLKPKKLSHKRKGVPRRSPLR